MEPYRLSKLAERDLETISDYTEDHWGKAQAERYILSIKDCLLNLANSPLLGRTDDRKRPSYRRFEQESHVIFYKPESYGIFVGRILHRRMLARLHSLE